MHRKYWGDNATKLVSFEIGLSRREGGCVNNEQMEREEVIRTSKLARTNEVS